LACHDLRTPLTSVLTAAQQLRHECTPALIDTIESEAIRLNRFVSNLLDMARVEAGALNLRIESVDLTDAVAGAVHDVRATLDGHAVRLEVSPNLPLVLVDPQLFHHCLLNLLDNAGRYADPGTPITISGERRPDSLILRVRDEGPGLPPGSETAVFETFHRLDGSDRTTTGTGLGLAIVKGFAEGMGLSVGAANRDDRQGAVFSLEFPERLLMRERAAEGDE
jgi:two-component system sensor histidine kinase KdpD